MSARRCPIHPPNSVNFQPVPFKLLRIVERNGREYVAGADYGDYQGLPFDPWQRGDLVGACLSHSSWHRDHGQQSYDIWCIAKRANVPSAPRVQLFLAEGRRVTVGGPSGYPIAIYRIPYHWRPAAKKLFGREFETREALEQAMEAAQ